MALKVNDLCIHAAKCGARTANRLRHHVNNTGWILQHSVFSCPVLYLPQKQDPSRCTCNKLF